MLRVATLLAVAVLLCSASTVTAKLQPGASCGNAKDHCESPKSGMGCCVPNSKCYSQEDCASFLKTCPFSDDTKKGNSLADCLPDKSDFIKATCSAEAKGKIQTTDGKGVPLAAKVTCFASEKVTCEIYKNATGHGFITAACKGAPAKKASAAEVPVTALWQCCLLLGLLATSLLAVMGMPL